MKQATFWATITDTTAGIVAGLLTRASNDPASTASTGTPDHTPVTSHDTFSVSPRTVASLDALQVTPYRVRCPRG
jgi:hypothetical protein